MRKIPYTKTGIKRLKCLRCGSPASEQWQICADNNTYRPICKECDMLLNKLVLRWMGFKDWDKKIKKYIKRINEL